MSSRQPNYREKSGEGGRAIKKLKPPKKQSAALGHPAKCGASLLGTSFRACLNLAFRRQAVQFYPALRYFFRRIARIRLQKMPWSA